jgi:hypothetical protein
MRSISRTLSGVATAGMLLLLTACTAATPAPPSAGSHQPLDELWSLDGVELQQSDDRFRFDAAGSCSDLAMAFEGDRWRSVPLLLPSEQSGIDEETGEPYTVTLSMMIVELEGAVGSAMVTAIDNPGLCSADLVFSTDVPLTVSGAIRFDGTARQLPFLCTPVLGSDDETTVTVFLDAPGAHIMLSVAVTTVKGPQDIGGDTAATAFAGELSIARRVADTLGVRLTSLDENGTDPLPGEFRFTGDSHGTVTLEGQKPIRGHLEVETLEDVTGARIDIATDFRC